MEMYMLRRTILATAVLAAMAAGAAARAEDGNWLVRLRAINVDPQVSTSGALSALGMGVASQWAPEVDLSYFFTKNIAVEVIAATSSHNVSSNVLGPLGSTKVLPPTVTAQWHFDLDGGFKPYVGAGVNYTLFYNNNLGNPLTGPLTVSKNSWGPALQVGLDYRIKDQWYVNADIKKIWIQTDVSTATGVPLGTLKINPFVFGVGAGYRF
jgi:outer membrane protein